MSVIFIEANVTEVTYFEHLELKWDLLYSIYQLLVGISGHVVYLKKQKRHQ